MSTRVFMPAASATLAVGVTSANVALPGAFGGTQRRMVRLYNAGTVEVFVRFGPAGVSAAADGTDMSLPPGVIELFEPAQGHTHIAAVCASGTATLRITTGEGI